MVAFGSFVDVSMIYGVQLNAVTISVPILFAVDGNLLTTIAMCY